MINSVSYILELTLEISVTFDLENVSAIDQPKEYFFTHILLT